MQPNIELSDWGHPISGYFYRFDPVGFSANSIGETHWFLMSSVIYPLRTDIRKPD